MSIQGYLFTCFSLYSCVLVYTCIWAPVIVCVGLQTSVSDPPKPVNVVLFSSEYSYSYTFSSIWISCSFWRLNLSFRMYAFCFLKPWMRILLYSLILHIPYSSSSPSSLHSGRWGPALFLDFYLYNICYVRYQNMFILVNGRDKGAGSFHTHRKTVKDFGALAVLGIREQPNLAHTLVTQYA